MPRRPVHAVVTTEEGIVVSAEGISGQAMRIPGRKLEYDHPSRTDLGIIKTRGNQVFGEFNGWVRVDGEVTGVRNLFGWAENVAQNW